MKKVRFSILITLFSSTFSFSVDSAISQVGPKEAAQRRQAEMFCNEKAAREKVTKRDLASYVVGCMVAIEKAEKRSRITQ